MTPEEMLSAILERMGWTTHEKESGDGEMHIFYKTPEGHYRNELPKLSLELMHEAEKYASEHLMDAEQWEKFGRALEKAHPTACVLASGCDTKSPIDYYDLATLITGLSAAQHAEAFCRTLFPERFK